ncbi:MAG: hypothetical protein FWF44_11100, partial [Defluviitaleaceae bacterium]|nr:hypothetical protein [Defluviitaleaceae bacterium]
ILKEMGFKASLSCWEGVNIVASGNPECLYKMRRSIRKHGQPVSDVLSDAYMRLKKERANSVKTD